jgi:ApaG protein
MNLPYQVTEGIRISAMPFFLAEQSQPDAAQYVFAYHIRIENQGEAAARLRWRHWFIHDPAGGDQEVEGEGVVGEQPLLEPGEAYEYQSFCVLEGPEGHMQGHYEFARADGTSFRAAIPRFLLRIHAA